MAILKNIGLTFVVCMLISSQTVWAIDHDLQKSIDDAKEAGKLQGLHQVIVYHKGKLIVDASYQGLDQRWGSPLGMREFDDGSLHDLRSVTKSITSLIYGIALAEGKVPDPSRSLYAAFPKYKDLGEEEGRSSISVDDTLSMRMGIEWDESLPYTDKRNSEIAMEFSKDRYHYVLSRPLQGKPGEKWVYNGGATALVGRLIAQGTGVTLDAYAKEKLFDPMGIDQFEWVRGADKEPSAASGLRLRAKDLAKIGLMINQGGKWQGKQIVPLDWIKTSLEPRTVTSSGLKYGYFWYLSPRGEPPYWAAGFGNGGQQLIINKGLDFVVVIYAGNYNQRDAWKMPRSLVENHLLPKLLPK
ncbi:serine hydrolase domain-containing protein [Cohaesibacter gelatinilyticus]|nr:serine hydrolase [Cohaesibacter gelatinilyticus]